MNHWDVIKIFEENLAHYTNAKYAVAVDSCTSAIFLCCKYLSVDKITIPKKTYISVPFTTMLANAKVSFSDEEWDSMYYLKPFNIIDAALLLDKDMYINDTFMCLSFNTKKPLGIGKGGCILTDNKDAYEWFKKARCNGRSDVPFLEDQIDMIGYNVYMTPDQAARGIELLANYKYKQISIEYPDISQLPVFRGTQ